MGNERFDPFKGQRFRRRKDTGSHELRRDRGVVPANSGPDETNEDLASPPPENAASEFTERDGKLRGPLHWLIPELDRVRGWTHVLADSAASERHPEAAWNILRSLNLGLRELRDLRRMLPAADPRQNHEVAEHVLYDLGHHLHTALRAQGQTWPPPRPRPPSSVTIDLVALYRYGSGQTYAHGDRPDLLFRAKIDTVIRRTQVLIDRRSTQDVRAVRRMSQVPGIGAQSSRIANVLSGTALVISLAQGPGAFHDLPGDVRDLSSAAVGVFDQNNSKYKWPP